MASGCHKRGFDVEVFQVRGSRVSRIGGAGSVLAAPLLRRLSVVLLLLVHLRVVLP